MMMTSLGCVIEDKQLILIDPAEPLNDILKDSCIQLLRRKYPNIEGLQSPMLSNLPEMRLKAKPKAGNIFFLLVVPGLYRRSS